MALPEPAAHPGSPDLIVVGAGSAGCALARRIADEGIRVVLVEAGKSDRHLRSLIPALVAGVVRNPDFDWCYQAEPDPSVGGRSDPWPAGKRLGGGSAINGMMFVRGHRYDYDRWAELGAEGWDYASVLPYFRRLETNERGVGEWRGRDGPISVAENRARYPVSDAWVEAVAASGVPRSADLNGSDAEGVDFVQLSQRSGLRCSSAAAYLRNGGRSGTLELMLETHVLRILTDGRRAVGLHCRRGNESFDLRARYGVVVCAGALNTPKLLMLSGLGPAASLAAAGIAPVLDLPAVGGNLQEHVGTHLVHEVDAATLNEDARGWRGVIQLLRFALFRTGALTTGLGHAQAFIRTRADLPAPNIQLAFSPFAFDVTATGNIALHRRPAVSTLVGLMRPDHRGRITLSSADPADPPIIEHRLLGSQDDVDQLVEGLQAARHCVEQMPFRAMIKVELRPGAALAADAQVAEYVRASAVALYHPVGTVRMGRIDDPEAVVDPQLRVRGMEGLWVADASIMPTLPSANTNAAALMIGEKGADLVMRAIANG